MKKDFFHGTTRGMRIAFSGFIVALVGIAIGFSGFYAFKERWVSILGFIVVVLGVFAGFIGVIYGWIHDAKPAIKGSAQAMQKLRSKFVRGRDKVG